ncbi:MAG: hypothetical protein CMH48_01540 [Muricauda sp.]|nr:Plug domain-containing protein [Allomuricauda sp.]MBC29505.1 hypothetical protein [Allomuricauda sp.]|tara:strand:+ start:1091 stop:1495 length:405 start_codon:yes stop_codon:yes gene_type:complete
MKKLSCLLVFILIFGVTGCSSTKKKETTSMNVEQELERKNRGQVSLLTRIRQLPGVSLKNGVPVINKASNNLNSRDFGEPLYVLNGQIIGNSFSRIDELVDSFNVKKIEVVAGPDTSFYGAQGAKGVIKITTFQ